MSYRIIWTESAKKSFDEVVEYLFQEWSQKDVSHFIHRTERVLSLISKSPRIYPIIYPVIHRCLLSKHNSIFYTIENDQVCILACWDNRKDPKEFKL
jgi:plasmid stabilization system protein ParE